MKRFLANKWTRSLVFRELLFVEVCAILVMVGIEVGLGNRVHLQQSAPIWSTVALNWVALTIIGSFGARIGMHALDNWRIVTIPRHFMALILVVIALPFSRSVAALFVVIHEAVELWQWYRKVKSSETALLDLHPALLDFLPDLLELWPAVF